MNKICTDIYQSKKIIGLGIDVNTTDMRWQNNEFQIGFNDDGIPAWSLSALLKIAPSGKILLHDKVSGKYKCISPDGTTKFKLDYEPLIILNKNNVICIKDGYRLYSYDDRKKEYSYLSTMHHYNIMHRQKQSTCLRDLNRSFHFHQFQTPMSEAGSPFRSGCHNT